LGFPFCFGEMQILPSENGETFSDDRRGPREVELIR